MNSVPYLLILIFLHYDFASCDRGPRCQWSGWKDWDSCSRTCGGGTQRRRRGIYCDDGTFQECLDNCGKSYSDSYEEKSCNEWCDNGVRYTGECSCPDELYGYCCSGRCPLPENCKRQRCSYSSNTKCIECQDQGSDVNNSLYWLTDDQRGCDATCSWKENWCWPGTCKDNLAKNCICGDGFTLVSTEPAHCGLSKKPDLVTCKVGTEKPGSEVANSTNTDGTCETEASFYVKYQPSTVLVRMESTFSLPAKILNMTKPKYIEEYALGIVGNQVVVNKFGITGGSNSLLTINLKPGDGCDQMFNPLSPFAVSPVSCTRKISTLPSWQLEDGEKLCLSFVAKAGGYLQTSDFNNASSSPHFYTSTRSSHDVCVKYDVTHPKHCQELGKCELEPIQIPSRITRDSTLTVNISGWVDPFPLYPDQASGIDKYTINLHEVKENNSILVMDNSPLQTFENASLTEVIELPKEPALYAISLDVVDVAGNPKFARRFVLYDNSSIIKVHHDGKLRFDSANPSTNFTWQNHHGDICLSWWNRYYNSYNAVVNLLRPIATDYHGLYEDIYEQLTGVLPVSGTPNVDGIVQFMYTWSKNDGVTSPRTNLSNVTEQSICRDYYVKDGDTVNITVISVDIMDNSFSESLQVYIDASVPDINNIWLIRDGLKKLYVHNSTDLSKMKIEFEALDQHSGIHSIEWHLGTTVGGNELGYRSIGVQAIANQSLCKNKRNCYCPDVGTCETLIYTADFNSLVHGGKNIGNHNREYFFTLKVTNKAMLVSIQRTDILLDDSKPEAGVVFEGVPNSPDIDYTADDEVMINWHGFIDHESGIMKYRVGLADHCMDHGELQHYIHNLTGLGYLTETKQTSLKVKIPGTGKYYTSIIAYNNAVEPSNVVCSDGITLDTSKPHFQNLKVENARTNPIVGCFNNSVYLVTENITAVEMTLTEDCKSVCNRSSEMTLLQFLPKSPHVYNDTDIADDMCRRQKRFTDDWFMYLPSDRIFMEWETYDPESQMREVEVGYASDSTQFANPDLSSYAKTHRMLRYSSVHSGLDTGSPLYIMIRATNKAGLQTNVPFGPLVIDETPPIINDGPKVEVHGENIVAFWGNQSFQDPEEMTALQTLLFKLGNNEAFLTPILQAQILHHCPVNATGSLCFLYPVQRVQKEDTEKGLMFYFELHVYNTAGHSTSVRTPHFMVPSRYPPGHGTVIDIDINSTDPTLDVDYILSTGSMCARWDGFSHHENVTFELGIGSSIGKDDVIPFQVVSGQSACIASNVNPFVKYFTTVRASCSGGTTTVSSDGFIVINETQALQQVHVYDGEPCSDESLIMSDKIDFSQTNITYNISTVLSSEKVYSLMLPVKQDEEVVVTSDEVVWTTDEDNGSKDVMRSFIPNLPGPSFLIAVRRKNHNGSDDFRRIKILNCNKDQQVQRSRTSYKGYWVADSKIIKFISHYEVGLSKMDEETEEIIQPLIPVYNRSSVVINDIHLEYNKRYNLVLQVCFQHVCLQSMYSKGSVVELTQPIARDIHVTMRKINKTFVETTVSLDLFECGVSTSADTYLSAFSKTKQGDNQITKWQRITGLTNVTSGLLTARYATNLPVYHYQDLFVCVKGICRSGASTRACAKADMTSPPNDFDSNVVYEIDTDSSDIQSLENLLHSKHIGHNLAKLHKRDVDFIEPGTRISGALTNSAGRVIEWYLMKNPTIPAGPCSDDTDCIQHVHSESGIATFRRWNLQTNRKYFICAYSNYSYIDLERTPENLAEVKICGNGFVVDGSPPISGNAEIKTENGFISDNEILITWSEFSDIERDAVIEYQSGILSYAYALGTYPGGTDVSQYTNIGLTQSAILHNIIIKNGLTIYASVKAHDFVGHTTVVTSTGATVDMTPPVPGFMRVGNMRHQTYFVSSKYIQIEWNGFEDPESGIEQIQIGVGSSNHSADVKSMERYDDEYVLIENGDGFVDGHQYYALISVRNRAGLSTTVASPPFVVDVTPPVAGYVRDGKRTEKADVDYQRDITELSSHWDGFTDPHSGISYYEVGIGTYPLQADIEGMVNVGLRTDKTWRNLFFPGTKYYITVRACNGAGLCSTSSSDGVILDNSPPIPGIVHVGLSDRHQNYLSHRSSISAQWFGFQDPHSYIQYFEWCLGTSKESCDLHKFENVLLSNSIVKTGLDLPDNTAMYVTVRAYNNLGLYTQRSSEAFFVDTTPPIVKRKPYFVLNKNAVSHRLNSQWESSFIELAWEFYDLESSVTGHSILLKNHETGHTVIDSISVANENSTTIRLHNDNFLKSGDRYTAWVTACNAAALCQSAKTNDILIDATPPHLGGFKNPMTWQTVNESGRLTEIDVQWYGFVDAESDIEGYYLTVSRNYSDSELSGGIVQVESQNSSDQARTIRLTGCVENGENIVLSVWAVNKVGLRSSIGRVTVTLVANDVEHDSGFLEIQRHSCSSKYCNNDCTCAVIGLKCIRTLGNSPCTEIQANTTSTYQAVDVKFGRKPKQTKVTGSSLCLEGYWTLLNPNVFPVMRFEWSMGVKDERPGTGIFVEFKEAVWYDVGKYTNITHCLTNGKRLEHNELYVLYVKAWYSYTDYMVFTSDPVLVDLTPPTVRRGASVFESVDGCSTDIDFLNATFDFVVCWSRVFSESVNTSVQYAITGGSSPFGDDLLSSVSVGTHTFYSIKGSLLQPGTTYYFTVLAKNSIGLITSLVSDGVLIDLDKPSSGIVFNTKHHRNVLQQSDTDHIGISWHGFDDHHSSIRFYSVSIVDAVSGEIIVNTDTSGITNSIVIDHLSLLHDHHYQAEVVAFDAAGHASNKVTSEQVLIDSTSPNAYICSRYEDIGELNTTITFNAHLHGQQKVYIHGSTDVSKDEIYELMLFLSDPIISGTVQAQFDENLLSIPVTENSNGSVTVEHKFISSREGEMDISMYFCQETKYYPSRVHLKLRSCVSKSVANEHAVQVKQLSPNTLSFFSFATDDESELKSVQVGAGLTRNGYQIRALSPVSRDSMTSLTFDAPHGSKVFVTLMAENNANLVSFFTSDPLVVDHTKPEITDSTASLTTTEKYVDNSNSTRQNVNGSISCNSSLEIGDDVSISTRSINESAVHSVMSSDIDVQWKVTDPESGVLECHCSAGVGPGSTTIQDWKQTKDNKQCQINDLSLHHGTVVYVNIRCINKVQLSHVVHYGPMIVSFESPERTEAEADFVLSNRRSNNHNDPSTDVQSNTSLIHFYWDGFQDVSGITYETRLSAEGGDVYPWSDNSHRTFMSYAVQPHSPSTYTAHVRARNLGNVYSVPVNKTITLLDSGPKLTGQQANIQPNGGRYVIKWTGVFESSPFGSLLYWVSVGSQEGNIDIHRPTSSSSESIDVIVDKNQHSTLYLSVTAFDTNAEYTKYSKIFYL